MGARDNNSSAKTANSFISTSGGLMTERRKEYLLRKEQREKKQEYFNSILKRHPLKKFSAYEIACLKSAYPDNIVKRGALSTIELLKKKEVIILKGCNYVVKTEELGEEKRKVNK